MKAICRLISVMMLLPVGAFAGYNARNYLAVEGGIAFYEKFNNFDDYNNRRPKRGAVFGAGVGRNFNDNFAIEFNIHRFGTFKFDHLLDPSDPQARNLNQKFSATNFGINCKYNFAEIVTNIRPFINAGIGYSSIEARDVNQSSALNATVIPGRSKDNMSYNFGLGIGAAVIKNLTFKLSYQYFNLGKFTTANYQVNAVTLGAITIVPYKANIKTQSVLVGLQYHF